MPKKSKDKEEKRQNRNKLSLSVEESSYEAERLCTAINNSVSNIAGLVNDIEEYNKMYEVRPEKETLDFPWDDAPNYRSPFVTYTTKGIANRVYRVILGTEPYCLIKGLKETVDNVARQIEKANSCQDFLHFILKYAMRISKIFRVVFKHATLEPSVIVKLGVTQDWEELPELESYDSEEEFKARYPSAEMAKIPEEEYKEYLKELKDDGRVTVPTRYYDRTYLGPKPTVVERKDFVLLPHDAIDRAAAWGMGHRVKKSGAQLREGEAMGWYENIEELKKEYEKSAKKGIKDKSAKYGDFDRTVFECFECLVKQDRNGDGIPEKYIETVVLKEQILIRAERWDYNLYFIPFQIEPKANSIDGMGTGQMLEKTVTDNDSWHNIRTCAGILSVSPALKIKKGQGYEDEGWEDFYPGVKYWLKDLGDLEQFYIQSNFSEGYKEEEVAYKNTELITGFTSGGMGSTSELDPRAPATKHLAMLREMNINIDSYISCIRDSMEEFYWAVMQICSRYMPEEIEYFVEQGTDLERKTINRKELKISSHRFVQNATSLLHNKAMKMQENMENIMFLMKFPMVNQNPQAERFLVNKYIVDADMEGRDIILPTEEKLMEEQIQTQMAAIKRIQAMEQAKAMSQQMIGQGVPVDEIKRRVSTFLAEQGALPETKPEEVKPV